MQDKLNNPILRKHLGGEPPIYPIYPIDKEYALQNSYKLQTYLAAPTLMLQKYASEPIAPTEIVNLPLFTFEQDEFNQLYSSYAYEESKRMFELFDALNGNFVILADRLDKSIVDIQQWYFEIYHGIMRLRRQPVAYPPFDLETELKRRANFEFLMNQDNTEEELLAISYYTFKDKPFMPNGFKKLPETELSESIPQGLPGNHKYISRSNAPPAIKEVKDKENKHELIRKQGVHLVTTLLPIPKIQTLQKSHDIILELLEKKGLGLVAKALYSPNLAKAGGLAMPTQPLLSKYLKVRLLAIKLADHRRKNK